MRVQPGIVRDRLNHVLRPHGRYFPPDPSNTNVTTIGGMLGVDAAGSHAIRVGSSRDHVESLEVVLAGGRIIEAGQEPLEMLKTPPRPMGLKAPLPNRNKTIRNPPSPSNAIW